MKISLPVIIFLVCLLPYSEESLMDTLMTPVTWLMQAPSAAMSWYNPNRTTEDRSNIGDQETISSPSPLVSPVNEPETLIDVTEDRVDGNISDISEIDSFDGKDAFQNSTPIENSPHNLTELSSLPVNVEYKDEIETPLEPVNDSLPITTPTISDERKPEISSSPIPLTNGESEVTTVKNHQSTQIINRSTEAEVKTASSSPPPRPIDTTPLYSYIVNTIGTRSPRKHDLQANRLQTIELKSNITSEIVTIPTTTNVTINSTTPTPPTSPIYSGPTKTLKGSTGMTTPSSTTPVSPIVDPMINWIEIIANLTSSHHDYRKGRQEASDDTPQPVYVPEQPESDVTEKDDYKPHFEFHSELAKAFNVHHNIQRIAPNNL